MFVCMIFFHATQFQGRIQRVLLGLGLIPQKDHLVVNESTYEKVPLINFLDLVDTRSFGSRAIDKVVVP